MTSYELPGRPRPLRAAAPWGALAVPALALGADRLALMLVAAPFALIAAGRAVHERRELSRLRRAADQALLRGSHSALVEWRASELLSERHRSQLAHSLHGLVRELDGRSLPGASPVNRAAARPLVDELRSVATLVADAQHQLSPRGILLLDELLTDGSGPLYSRERTEELPQALHDAHAALRR